MSGSSAAVARELARHKLYLVDLQKVRWDKEGIVRVGNYFFYGKETKIINWVQFRICTTEFYQQLRPKESLGWYELKQRKPWFDEECLRFLDQRKQAEMLWLQSQNQNNV
jgi:hypothetical protein